MSVLSRIGQMFMRSKAYRVFQLTNTEVYAPIDGEKAIEKGFNSNTAVYSIVMKYATKFGCVPRYVYDKSKSEEKAYKKKKYVQGALTDLLNRPNEYQSQDAFFTAVAAFYKVAGEAFIWLNRGDTSDLLDDGRLQELSDEEHSKKPVLEMYVLPPKNVGIVPADDNLWGVKEYFLDIVKKIPIRKVDMIHWKSTNLKFGETYREHLRGFPPLEAGYKTLQQNNDATNAAVRMYQNDGAKGVLFNETMQSMSPAQESDVRKVVDRKINNNDVKGAVATLQGKWGFLNFGGTSVDMQLLDGKELSWKELCFLLSVPYEFFDSETTFANKEQAMVAWVTNDIYPAAKQLDGELNRVLLKSFALEKRAYIGSDISELYEIRKAVSESGKAMAENWTITGNEVREYLGYERLEDPVMDEVLLPSGRTPLSQTGESEADQIMNELEIERLSNEVRMGNSNGNGKVPQRRT